MTFFIFVAALTAGLLAGSTAWVFIESSRIGAQPDSAWVAWYQFGQAVHTPGSRMLALITLAVAAGVFLGVLTRLSDLMEHTKPKRRGASIVNTSALCALTRRRKSNPQQVTVGSVPLPVEVETTHMLFVGSTGSGKSNAQQELLAGALARGDRVVVVDPNGEALSRHFKKGDCILNPFDARTQNWSVFNELRQPADYDRIAIAIVPTSTGEDETWRAKARTLLVELLEAMVVSGKPVSARRLQHWVAVASREKLKVLLAGKSSEALLQPDAGRLLDSVRGVLSGYLRAHVNHPTGTFSLGNWLVQREGNLYLTWHADQIHAVKPLINCWLEILITSILASGNTSQRVWLFIDELGSLEKMASLEAALTKGRKHGLRVVACLQSTSQLAHIYGKPGAETLRSCFRTLLILGGSATDPETSKAMSEGLGDVEVEAKEVSVSRDGLRRTTNESTHVRLRKLVLPSEIQALPVNEGYLKLPGNLPVARIRVKPPKASVNAAPFQRRT